MCRSPWCSKEGLNRGAWSAEEDMILWEYIRKHGDGGWSKVPQKAGLKRCGKSCRIRWVNYVRPDIRRGNICPDEEELICRLHRLLGNRWSLIAGRLPGRTGNEIKNYWNTHLKKKLLKHESQPKTMSKSPSPIQNHVFKTTPVGITTAMRHTEMETANCCSNHITSDHALNLSTIEENAYSSRSGCNLPGYDCIRKDDSESIAFPMENVDLVEADQGRNSMSSLVVQQSPQSDQFAGIGDIRAESLFDPNEPSSPDFNLLSSPSIWTDFGLQEFYMGLPPNEPYSPDFNMLSYPSISTDFGLEELYMGLPTSLDAETCSERRT